MPIEPSTYVSGPVSPQQLDTDLYSYSGTGFGANGILFLAHRPVLSETLLISPNLPVSTTGTWSPIESTGVEGFNVLDNAALFGLGSDSPGYHTSYHLISETASAAGSVGVSGGQFLVAHFVAAPGFTSAAAVGAGMYLQPSGTSASALFNQGSMQRHAANRDSCAPYVDLLRVVSSAQIWEPAAFLAAGAGTVSALHCNATDTAGETTRFLWMWTGVYLNGGTVSSIPAPATNWGTVTSAALNVAVGSALTFLYYPPLLRVNQALTTSIPNSSNTKIPWAGGVDLDTYGGFGTATSTYTAKMPGLYLVAPTVSFTANGTGHRFAGVQVTYGGTGTTTTFQGPCNATVVTGGVTTVMQTRVLDLHAADTLTAYCFQDSGGALTLAGANSPAYSTRLVMVYLGPTGSGLTYTAPNTAFRWMAGQASGQTLLSLLNTHLGNDINFLLNRPYFTGYQQSAQTGFTNNSGFYQLTIDTVGGVYRASPGDSYGGWSASNHWYVSQVAGWYMVIAEVFATLPTTTSGYITAAIFCSSSGGQIPSVTPDWYQHLYYNSTTGSFPGACAIGLYYLQPGEYVYPMIQTQDWTGTTWGTAVNSGTETYSQFTVLWVCE